MPFIQVKVVAGVFTAQQKREIVERLTEAMVAIEGEGMRKLTWCVVEEIPSGDLGHRRRDDHRRRCEGDREGMRSAAMSAHPARLLYLARAATLLVLAVFSAFVVTVGGSVRSLGAGITDQKENNR